MLGGRQSPTTSRPNFLLDSFKTHFGGFFIVPTNGQTNTFKYLVKYLCITAGHMAICTVLVIRYIGGTFRPSLLKNKQPNR